MTDTDPRLEAVIEILDQLASAVERIAPANLALRDVSIRAGRLQADALRAFDQAQCACEMSEYCSKFGCIKSAHQPQPESEVMPHRPARHISEARVSNDKAPAPVMGAGYPTETDAGLLARLGDDASKWASEFQQTAIRLGYSDMDEGWLLGWFANAIEHSHSLRQHRTAAVAVMGADPLDAAAATAREIWGGTIDFDELDEDEQDKWRDIVRVGAAFANAQPDRATGSNNARGSAPPWIGVAVETFLACRPTEGSDRERLGQRLHAVLDWYNSRPPSEKEIDNAWCEAGLVGSPTTREGIARILIAAAKARSGV